MQLRKYAKSHSIPCVDIIESLSANYPGTWLLTSILNTEIIEFLDQTFADKQLQLPQAQERLQLPQSEQTRLSTIDSSQISSTTLQTSNLPTSSSLMETLLQANLEADEIRINQIVDGHYQRVTNILGEHYDRVENELLGSLKAKYNAISSHQKTSGFISNQPSKLEEFQALKNQLKAVEADIKS